MALQEGQTIFLEKSMLLASWGRTARYCSAEKTTVPEFWGAGGKLPGLLYICGVSKYLVGNINAFG